MASEKFDLDTDVLTTEDGRQLAYTSFRDHAGAVVTQAPAFCDSDAPSLKYADFCFDGPSSEWVAIEREAEITPAIHPNSTPAATSGYLGGEWIAPDASPTPEGVAYTPVAGALEPVAGSDGRGV